MKSNSYYVTVERENEDKIAVVSASLSGSKSSLATTLDTKKSDGSYLYYQISLPETISQGDSLKLKLKVVLVHALKPFPESIKLGDDQFMLYYGNVYFTTPYLTKSQSSQFKFGNGKLESYSEVQPVSQTGDIIKFGPYSDIEAFEYSKMRVHYVNNYPFAVFSRAERDIEISQWGAVAVEEVRKHVWEGG